MDTPPAAQRSRTWQPNGWVIGILSGLLALAPWLLKGERLPLQNLWRVHVLPQDFPWSMLPLSQYFFDQVLALLAVGGVIAGLTLRGLGRTSQVRQAHLGLALVQLLAVVQSQAVLWPGLRPGALSSAYEVATLAGCITGMVLGQLVLGLTASAKPWRVTIGLGLIAAVSSAWVYRWLLLGFAPYDMPAPVSIALHWLPAVVAGVGLAWLGLSTLRRRLTWVVCVAVLWTLLALLTALQGSVAVNTVRGGASEIITTFVTGLASAINPATGEVTQVAVAAVLIGLIGAGIRRALGRSSSQPEPVPVETLR